MVIITKVSGIPYQLEEVEIFGGGGSTGRIIFKSKDYKLNANFDIPQEIIEAVKENETLILCINGNLLEIESEEVKKEIESIFGELKIKCGICHPGGSDTLDEVKSENPFLNKIDLNTYSGTNQAQEILNYLNSILNSDEKNLEQEIKALYYYISKKKYLSITKNIISNWLPLAIDIQGLSEVYQKSQKAKKKKDWEDKAKEYWGEIKKSGPFLSLWGNHNEIAGDYQELKLDKSEESKLKTFLEELDSTNRKKIPEEKYLDPESDFFFLNWLEKYTKRIQ